ncbi:Cell division protein FtsL [bacterium HR19]|nr:Cell division protein FtsL [bacterium HR19]
MGDMKFYADRDKILVLKFRNKSEKGMKDILGFFFGVLLAFSPFFFTVYVKSQVIKQGYKISALVKKIEELQDKKEILEAKLMTIENPKNLYTIAKKLGYENPSFDKLGFISPKR